MSNIYTVTESDGSVRDIIADQAFVDQYYPGRWVLVGPEAQPDFVASHSTITRLAMIDRFSDAEYSNVLTAAKTDVEVQAWLDRLYASNKIDLMEPRTISGINALVSKGLLIQARADAILADPVQPEEIWRS